MALGLSQNAALLGCHLHFTALMAGDAAMMVLDDMASQQCHA